MLYQLIMVAVDGSTTSDLALTHAIKLAADQHAQLHLVSVVDEAAIFSGAEFVSPIEIEKSIAASARAVLDKAAALARQAGIAVTNEVIENDQVGQSVAQTIVAHARDKKADLLVIGTHGRRGMRHLLLGSVAETVVRESTVPVLLIRGS